MTFTFLDQGSGPALVLLHGIGSAARSFDRQIAAFAPRFRVVAWDAPGYGGSTGLPPAHPTAGDYADALDRFLAERGVDTCHLLGHSLGCLMVARFAATRPRRALSLTLCSVACGHADLSADERQKMLDQRIIDVVAMGPKGMAEKRAPRLLGPAAPADALGRLIDTMAAVRPHGYSQAARMLSTGDIKADIAKLPKGLPGQVIYGDADAITPPSRNQEVVAAWPGASARVIPGAGHALYLEQPERFNALLAAFLPRSTGTS